MINTLHYSACNVLTRATVLKVSVRHPLQEKGWRVKFVETRDGVATTKALVEIQRFLHNRRIQCDNIRILSLLDYHVLDHLARSTLLMNFTTAAGLLAQARAAVFNIISILV